MPHISGQVHILSGSPARGVAVSNGEDVALTNGNGRFTLRADPEMHPFIFAARPEGCSLRAAGWYARTPTDGGSVELSLEAMGRRSSKSRAPVMGHITDLHLDVKPGGHVSREMLARDLRTIHSRNPELELLVATGDLTNTGDLASLRALRRAFAASPIPVVAHFGGHDGNEERIGLKTPLPHVRHWEQVMGPTYFSLDVGRWHLVVCPDEDGFFGPERAALKHRWLEADLAHASGKRIVLAQHGPPTAERLELLGARGVELVLFGHWHSSKCYEHAGVLALGTPSLVYGGIDTMPRGFRVVTLGRAVPRTTYVALTRTRSPRSRSSARLEVNWRTAAPVRPGRGQPIACDGCVFVPLADEDYRGRAGVLCLDAETGKRKWLAHTRHSVRGTLALNETCLYAATQPGEVVCLDRESGQQRWARRLDGFPDRWIYNGPAVVDGVVVAGTGGDGIQAFDTETGEPRWKWSHPEVSGDAWSHYTPPQPIGRNIAVMVHRRGVWCLSARTGRPRWHYDARYEYLLAPMLLAGSRLLVPEADRFHALDAATGQRQWSRRLNTGEPITWACDDSLLVVNTAALRVPGPGKPRGLAQCRTASSGRLLWEFEYGRDLADMMPYRRGTSNALARPLLAPHAVYLAGLDGRLRALDRTDGKVLATVDIGEPIVSACLASDHSLLLTAYPGSIIAIGLG